MKVIKSEEAKVLRVTTRAEAKEASLREESDAQVVSVEQPVARPIEAGMMSCKEDPGDGIPVADRPAGRPEPGVSDRTIGNEKGIEKILVDAEVEDEDILEKGKDSYVECREGNEKFELRVKGRRHEEVVIPPVLSGNASRATLVEETKVDPSLSAWRSLADKEEQGVCVAR